MRWFKYKIQRSAVSRFLVVQCLCLQIRYMLVLGKVTIDYLHVMRLRSGLVVGSRQAWQANMQEDTSSTGVEPPTPLRTRYVMLLTS